MGTSKILIDGVGIDLTQDTVAAGKMLSGVKAHDSNGDSVTGSIPSKAAQTYTPGTADQTIAAGQYLSGAQTVKGDANLISGNIKQGVSIFGVNGNLTPGITPSGTKNITENGTHDVTQFASAAVNVPVPSDTTATAAQILEGRTAYVGGQKVTGEMKCKTFVWTVASDLADDKLHDVITDPDIAAHYTDSEFTVAWHRVGGAYTSGSGIVEGIKHNVPSFDGLSVFGLFNRNSAAGLSRNPYDQGNFYSGETLVASDMKCKSDGTLRMFANHSYPIRTGSYVFIVGWQS